MWDLLTTRYTKYHLYGIYYYRNAAGNICDLPKLQTITNNTYNLNTIIHMWTTINEVKNNKKINLNKKKRNSKCQRADVEHKTN